MQIISLYELKNELSKGKAYSPTKIKDEYIDIIIHYVSLKYPTECFQLASNIVNDDKYNPTSKLIGKVGNKILFHVDLKMTTWTTIGAILDIFITKGVSSTLLSALGLSGKSINLLSLTNAEACHCLLIKNCNADSIDKIVHITQNQQCHFSSFECRFKSKKNKCKIKKDSINKVITSLANKNIVKTNGDKLKII